MARHHAATGSTIRSVSRISAVSSWAVTMSRSREIAMFQKDKQVLENSAVASVKQGLYFQRYKI